MVLVHEERFPLRMHNDLTTRFATVPQPSFDLFLMTHGLDDSAAVSPV
jgi:hypothetical protein